MFHKLIRAGVLLSAGVGVVLSASTAAAAAHAVVTPTRGSTSGTRSSRPMIR